MNKNPLPLSEIRDPIIFVALKRVCTYVRNSIWMTYWGIDDKIEAATFEVAVDKSKEYEEDILQLADADIELDWGIKRVHDDPEFPGVATRRAGDFNPWYQGSLTLGDLLEALSGVAEWHSNVVGIDVAEFNHYYDFLVSYLASKQPKSEDAQRSDEISFGGLHPKIREATSRLFWHKHYAQAVFEAFKLVNNEVKSKSRLPQLDGKTLMEQAFSLHNPKIKLNDLVSQSDKDEQIGFMYIFSGAILGIRNPKAHDTIELTNPRRALEYLIFASLLLERLEEAEP
jgi:uncharacterized protein (TIGR02391 family)